MKFIGAPIIHGGVLTTATPLKDPLEDTPSGENPAITGSGGRRA